MKEKFVVSIVLPFTTTLFLIFSNYILALNLDINLMGDWAYLNSIIAIGFLFINVGFDSIHYQYSGKKNFDDYSGSYLLLKFSLLIINIILTLSLIFITNLWNSSYFPVLLLLLFSQTGFTLNNIFSITLRAKTKIFKCEFTLFAGKSFKALLILLVALNLSILKDPLILLGGIYLSTEILSIILFSFVSRKEFHVSKPRKSFIISYIKDSKPLILVSIIFILTQNIGNLILYHSWGSESLAYFNVVNINIITVLGSITYSLRPLCFSLYAKYFENGDFSSIKFISQKIERFSSILFLPIILIVLLNGTLIFEVFLPNYLNAAPVLYIMIFSPFLLSIGRPYYFQLTPGKHQKQSAIVDISVQLFSLILILILVPKEIFSIKMLGLGIIGYALALTIPRIYYIFISFYFSKKYFNIKSEKHFLIHFLIAIIALIINLPIKIFIIEPFLVSNVLVLLISSGVVIILFFVILILIKELTKDDFFFVLDLFRIKNYANSFKDEFNEEN